MPPMMLKTIAEPITGKRITADLIVDIFLTTCNQMGSYGNVRNGKHKVATPEFSLEISHVGIIAPGCFKFEASITILTKRKR